MEQLNKVELRGTVGSIKLQNFNDSAFARITIATNYAYKDKDGNAVIDTQWHNVVAWPGRNVSSLDKIQKGSRLYVNGRLRYEKYTGADGIERISSEIVATRLSLIDGEEPLQYEMQ